MAHGVFDLLHMGHVRHLEEVRRHASRLIVSVTPDRFVNKGPGVRSSMKLCARKCWPRLDASIGLPSTWRRPPNPLSRRSSLTSMPRASDYADASQDVTGKITAERNVVERNGGRILFTDGVTFSSSELINRYFNPFNPAVRAFLDTMRKNGERDCRDQSHRAGEQAARADRRRRDHRRVPLCVADEQDAQGKSDCDALPIARTLCRRSYRDCQSRRRHLR